MYLFGWTMKNKFQKITANLAGKPKIRTLEGKEYYVFPVKILKQGVLNKTLFRGREIKRFLKSWDLKPIVVNHPTNRYGEHISASSPKVLQQSKVGFLMRNKWDGEFQTAEAWVDKDRVKKIDPRIEAFIERGWTMEVSSGLFSRSLQKRGSFGGKNFKQIATTYQPDHLALLPDDIGACSLKDGCGMFTASKALSPKKMKMVEKAITNALAGNGKKCSCKQNKETNMKNGKKKTKDRVTSLILANVGWTKKDREWLSGLEKDDLNKLLVHAKKVKKLNSKLKSPSKPKSRKERDADADRLLASQKSKKKKKKSNLEGLDSDLLSRLKSGGKKKKKMKEEKILNSRKKKKKKAKLTAKEYVESAPRPIRDMLLNGLKAHGAERRRLVDIIVSSEKNQFEKEELLNEAIFPVSRLKKLANFVVDNEGQEEDSYSAFMGVPGAPITNSRKKDYEEQEHLELPTLPDVEEE